MLLRTIHGLEVSVDDLINNPMLLLHETEASLQAYTEERIDALEDSLQVTTLPLISLERL